MSDSKITLSLNDARKLYQDVLASNLLFIALSLFAVVTVPWLLLKIAIGLYIASTAYHIFQVRKVLIKKKPKNPKQGGGAGKVLPS